mgnify:CR=1 FL=1
MVIEMTCILNFGALKYFLYAISREGGHIIKLASIIKDKVGMSIPIAAMSSIHLVSLCNENKGDNEKAFQGLLLIYVHNIAYL